MAKILAPNKKYCGVSASVPFVNGVGYTDDEDLIKWFDEHGYEVEDEVVEDDKGEKPKGKSKKSKSKSDESGDKTEGEPGDESNDSGEDKPE